MSLSFFVENRDALRQRYFEAKDREDAAAVAHSQAPLGENFFSPQNRSSEERASLIGINLLEVMPKQLSAQARDIRPTLLSGKMIADLTQDKSFSVSEASMVNASLTEAIAKNQTRIWYRLEGWSCESSVLEFCRSFFTARSMREERSIQSYLIARIVNLTFCQQIDPAPELLDDMCYLVMCKVQDFVDIRFTEMEEELEEVEAGQRAFKKKNFFKQPTKPEKEQLPCGASSLL